MTGALAATLAALAAALLAGGGRSALRDRLASPVSARRGSVHGRRSELRKRPGWWSDRHRDITARLRARPRARQREDDVVEACLALGAELEAGAPVARALAVVAEDWPDLFGTAAARATIGGDVAEALRDAATRPGAASLRAVAAGWDVTDQTGAPLSRIVVAVADALRAEAAVRREAQSQLATARATSRLLAVLPFGTLLLLSGGNGAALEFLVTMPVGVACLGGAMLFVGAGLWWVSRLARSATRSAWET